MALLISYTWRCNYLLFQRGSLRHNNAGFQLPVNELLPAYVHCVNLHLNNAAGQFEVQRNSAAHSRAFPVLCTTACHTRAELTASF